MPANLASLAIGASIWKRLGAQYLMDNAVALASWSSICDPVPPDSVEIINMDAPELDVHNYLACGGLGDGFGDHFQSAQWILRVEPILYNGRIRHDF